MIMKVVCGDEDCRKEFTVDSSDRIWECDSCGRQIENKYYPFLNARLMQAKIEGDRTDWKAMFSEILNRAGSEIKARNGKEEDLAFLKEQEELLKKDMDNSAWRRLHDELLSRCREVIVALEDE